MNYNENDLTVQQIKTIMLYLLYFAIIVIFIGGIYIYYNPAPCPSQIHRNLFYPKKYKGIISGFNIDCTKSSFKIFIISLDSDSLNHRNKVNIELRQNYFCMTDKISVGDQIEKEENSFIINLKKKDGSNNKYDLDCENNCSCKSRKDDVIPVDWDKYVTW